MTNTDRKKTLIEVYLKPRSQWTPEDFKVVVDHELRGHEERRDKEAWEKIKNDINYPKNNINHPEHYNQGSVECIQAIEAMLNAEEFRGHCKANAVKYIWREKLKGGDESIDKAIWYLNRMRNRNGI